MEVKEETKKVTKIQQYYYTSANLNKKASIGELVTLPDLLILSCWSYYIHYEFRRLLSHQQSIILSPHVVCSRLWEFSSTRESIWLPWGYMERYRCRKQYVQYHHFSSTEWLTEMADTNHTWTASSLFYVTWSYQCVAGFIRQVCNHKQSEEIKADSTLKYKNSLTMNFLWWKATYDNFKSQHTPFWNC